MKDFLAKQTLKMFCAALMWPVYRFVLMPMLVSQVTELAEHSEAPAGMVGTMPTANFGDLSAINTFSPGVMNGMNPTDVQKQFAEVTRQLNTPNSTLTLKSREEASRKPAPKPTALSTAAATPKVNRQPQVGVVEGHSMVISPSKNTTNSVVIQPDTKTQQPAKCKTGT